MDWFFIALGGALGSMSRHWIGTIVSRQEFAMLPFPFSNSPFPYGTLTVNLVGSFIIGFAAVFCLADSKMVMPTYGREFLMIGFLGGFTTFSTFSLQTFDLIHSGASLVALANIVLSVLLCIVGAALGYGLGRLVNPAM